MKKDELKQPSDLMGGPNDLSRMRILHNHTSRGKVLRLILMLNLFPSVGTKVVKHYTTVEVHSSFPQGVVFLGDP